MHKEAKWFIESNLNFRMENKYVVKNVYPMHRVEDQIEEISGASVFLTLDLTKEYHQMKLAVESKEINSFTSPRGLFQRKVLPMGMKTSGAMFQRLIAQM